MKYEMIFGDEKSFDGAPDDAEYAGWFCQETRWYMILNGKILFSDGGTWCTSDNPYLSADIAAMRRIIKEPKRWTWEDKKAGVLPEVGCRVDFCHKLNTNWRTGEIKYADNQVVVIKADDINRPFVYEFDRVELKPIETAAEKAKREEDEFIRSISGTDIHYGTGTVKELFEQGARAAYRKMKGGE